MTQYERVTGYWEELKDYHVSDTYNDCLGSLFFVTEVHRQVVFQHSCNISGSFEQQSNNINGLYLWVKNLLMLIHKCIKPSVHLWIQYS